MPKKPEKPPISRKHIVWASLIIGLLFTYAGVREPFLEVITHFDFIVNFILNTLEAFLLIYLTYYLHFSKKLSFWIVLLVSLGVFYALEFSSYYLFDYDVDETTEFFSLTLPFGSMAILAFNLYYHLLRKQKSGSAQVLQSQEPLWLDTVSGRVKLDENDVQFAFLTEAYLEVTSKDGVYKTFYSLKQFEDLLHQKSRFFRLNKQFLGRRDSILSYRPLADGRLQITLPNDKECIVSKNKASSFKKWLSEP